MTRGNFTLEARDAQLRDGRGVHLRAAGPADEAELLQAFERLGPEARYMRFMIAIRQPNVERLRQVLASFPEKGFAVVATVPAADGIDIVAAASCMRISDEEGEFAISVVPAWAGIGLGTLMMNTLIDAARSAGFVRLRGFILATNISMIRLAAGVGFEVARDPGDFTIRQACLELGP